MNRTKHTVFDKPRTEWENTKKHKTGNNDNRTQFDENETTHKTTNL